ncbi:hypothetical protein CE143_20060 [Photorhabdus luminescens]|uniref:Uncharacterized protein n=1 Tax=Photorhabdus akhurstii TaxID=171438 RepID=A0ABX8LXX8_9GAMM|nr:hypothetical protein [Photorhabdus akhurstii]QXF35206.1 hypothetical protein B0X70_20015 [Photorhabdus akhurstii]UJD77039.1 hypothetical protein CE143_20060 [Photorhabdus luminescens]
MNALDIQIAADKTKYESLIVELTALIEEVAPLFNVENGEVISSDALKATLLDTYHHYDHNISMRFMKRSLNTIKVIGPAAVLELRKIVDEFNDRFPRDDLRVPFINKCDNDLLMKLYENDLIEIDTYNKEVITLTASGSFMIDDYYEMRRIFIRATGELFKEI